MSNKFHWNADGGSDDVVVDGVTQQVDAQLVARWENLAWDAHKGADVVKGEAHAEVREQVFDLLEKLPARMKAHHLEQFAKLGLKPAAKVEAKPAQVATAKAPGK